MRIDAATIPVRTDHPNEDYFLAGPEVAVLLDGAGLPAGLETGCRHGVAWFARRAGDSWPSAFGRRSPRWPPSTTTAT